MVQMFDFDRFATLSGSELVAYAATFLNDKLAPMSDRVLQKLLLSIPIFDDEHLVFVIELGADRSPAEIARFLPGFLKHADLSVCLAASRALERLQSEYITESLVNSVASAISDRPDRSFLSSAVDALHQRRAKEGKS